MYNAGYGAGRDLLLRPALQARPFDETLAGLGRDHGNVGNTPPLQLLSLFIGGDVQLAAPASVQRILKYVVALLARLHGYRSFWPEYSTR